MKTNTINHKIDSKYLKAVGAGWLRYHLKCPLVTFERGIWYYCHSPDILGVRTTGYSVEIEVKVTWKDFKDNFDKRCIINRKHITTDYHPASMYFIVPPELVDKIKNSGLLTDEGLLTVSNKINVFTGLYEVKEIITAKRRKPKKLTFSELSKLVRCQSNTLISIASSEVRNRIIKDNTEPNDISII